MLHAAQMTHQVWETPFQHQQIILVTDLIPILLGPDQTSDVIDSKLQSFRAQPGAFKHWLESRQIVFQLVEDGWKSLH